MRHRCAAFRVLLWGYGNAAVPSIGTLTSGMNTAYRGAPATFAYSGTRTDIYTMDTAYMGAPAVWAISA